MTARNAARIFIAWLLISAVWICAAYHLITREETC